ncbi:MAG: aspartate 1-decarboxylase [Deltaproteobacteria bacterium]|nr:aspartate 1-decarboxylase [Deltaproteobacteria bacterium]
MREFLRAKIHNATVTAADFEYEGSFGMDATFMKQVGIAPFESVEIYNVTNGARIRTYAIELPENSGRFESNGAAAHHIRPGDRVIIACYAWVLENEVTNFKGPKILILNEKNQRKEFFQSKPTQAKEATRQCGADFSPDLNISS